MASYTELKTVDVKASLAKQLLTNSNARLSMSQIQQILGWQWAGGEAAGEKESDSGYGDFGLTDLEELNIEVVEAREFAKALQLKDWEMSHSWAGDDITREWGFLVLGDAQFGQSYSYSFSNNGNLEADENTNVDGEFDLSQVQAVLVNREVNNHFNNNHYDAETWTLYVYIPGEKLVDDETYELGHRLGFLGKFAESVA